MPSCNTALAVLLLIASACAHTTAEHFKRTSRSLLEDTRSSFTEWVRHHSKAYAADAAEFDHRLQQWQANVAQLVEGQGATDAVKVNSMMDLSDEEFRAAYLGHRRAGKKADNLFRYRYVQPAKSVDWVERGMVGPIKNQHINGSACGCCWSFATIAVTESINALATGKMAVLSEQQLIDCDRAAPYYDLGCKGGDFEGGMSYIINHGGIDLEEDYPYVAKDSKCDRERQRRRVVTIDAVEDVPGSNDTALMQAVTMHPVGVGVCVGDYIQQWRAYTGGILKLPKNCEEPQDHAMSVVGYGEEEDGEKYWLVKNSWGETWGENGFLKLKRGLPGNGAVGMYANPGYPVKTSSNPKPKEEGSVASMIEDWAHDLFPFA